MKLNIETFKIVSKKFEIRKLLIGGALESEGMKNPRGGGEQGEKILCE